MKGPASGGSWEETVQKMSFTDFHKYRQVASGLSGNVMAFTLELPEAHILVCIFLTCSRRKPVKSWSNLMATRQTSVSSKESCFFLLYLCWCSPMAHPYWVFFPVCLAGSCLLWSHGLLAKIFPARRASPPESFKRLLLLGQIQAFPSPCFLVLVIFSVTCFLNSEGLF